MAPTAAQGWLQERSSHHSRFSARWLADERRSSISVCLPARECAGTVSQVVTELVALREAGAIDEVVVIDAASADGTAQRALDAGATVHQEAALLAEHGPVQGKGDAMWRALSVLEGELVCYLDADSERFSRHFATGLLGPLVADPEICFVKGFYRRPLGTAGDGGGRVNHLTARPALALFYPELAGVRQPLAGEVAARRSLLEQLPFTTGYGVEIAMLLDVHARVGLAGIAQVDLDEHHNPHQGLPALSRMAYAILSVLAERLRREGRLAQFDPGALLDPESGEGYLPELCERPSIASLGSRAS